nr:hypothetical protein [Tanacetum cinerariifolium]
MSAIANTTPLVTTVTKPATNPRGADATPRINIQEFFEEYYKDILPIIMDKVHRDRRKDVHTRQSAFDRLSETYLSSTTKSRPRGIDSMDRSQGRSRPYRLDTSNEDCLKDRECFCSVGESMMTFSPTSIKKIRSHLESVIFESSRKTQMPNNVKTYDGTRDLEDYVKIFQAAAHVERWAMITWCHMFNSTLIGAIWVWFDELLPERIDSYKYLKAAFLAYFMQQKKYVKDPMKIHNIKKKDGETIEDFMERFKVETGYMKGAPECMRISGFMHGLNILELTKRLNEHVSKTMEEMMITTTAFIRGEAAASKKKGHTSWKAQAVQKANFRQKPPPPMVTPVENRSSNKFCDFHNDKGHSTNECSSGTEGPLVIEAKMGGQMIHHMFVDGGSSMDILYEHYFNQIRPKIKSQMVSTTTSLTGLSGKTIWPLRQLRLLVIIGDTNYSTRAWINFMIVRSLSPYSGIIGRPRIREIQATLSLSKEEKTRSGNFKVTLHLDFPDQEVEIEGTLSEKERIELCSILKKNLDIFAWQPSDMKGVPGSVAEHRLNIREGYSPVYQETLAVFPSASYHDRYRSTHQANHVSSRCGRTTAKIEYHARRTQYHVQAKNVSHMTDLRGFSYRNAGRKPTSRASGRNSTRGMNTLHGWLITYGWVRDRKKARKLRIKARQYELMEGILLQAVVPYAMVKMCWTAPGAGTEAVIPAEIGMPTYRTTAVDVVSNDEELWLNLNLLKERRKRAAICEAKAKLKMMKYYNARVRGITFRPGDFVYRNNDASHAVAGGKLGPKWERPYEVTKAPGDGAYKLQSMDETILPRTWNIANLKRCYL